MNVKYFPSLDFVDDDENEISRIFWLSFSFENFAWFFFHEILFGNSKKQSKIVIFFLRKWLEKLQVLKRLSKCLLSILSHVSTKNFQRFFHFQNTKNFGAFIFFSFEFSFTSDLKMMRFSISLNNYPIFSTISLQIFFLHRVY